MAGGMSNYLENKVLDHVMKKTQFTQPSYLYVALSTSSPNDTGSEISEPIPGQGSPSNGYARANASASFATATNGQISNSVEIAFPEATANWGTITHFAIYDANTNGNMLWWGELATPKAVNSGDQARFAVSQLTLTLD